MRRAAGSHRGWLLVGKITAWTVGSAVALGAVAWVAFQVSPWPSALLIRAAFDDMGVKTGKALEPFLPDTVTSVRDLQYGDGGSDTSFDVFYPSEVDGTSTVLPTVVWVHGGGWVSGDKDQIANYLEILAGRGYTVVGLNYSIAPGATYPTPLRQVNDALGYLSDNAEKLHIDSTQLVLAGDSAGSQIAAQISNVVTSPGYAELVGIRPAISPSQLSGAILHCGAYDIGRINLEGPFGGFLRTVLWSYTGTKDFSLDPRLAEASVVNYVTADFPPVLISGGNGDSLTPQSVAFADRLEAVDVSVARLFFPEDYAPKLPHEYQFDLTTDAGQVALQSAVEFLDTVVAAR